MGIVLLPIFMATLWIVVRSVKDIFQKASAERFDYLAAFFSPFVTGTIYFGLVLFWKIEGRVYAFAPFFLTALFCIFAPFLLSQLIERSNGRAGNLISNLLKCSVIVGFAILIIFNGFLLDITQLLGIETYH
ncbi:MAG TPA: hypothetical protein VFT06_11785 [Flavisolibacter sp.]|nr:hypothetical protein [Flavisolibacter sp.]